MSNFEVRVIQSPLYPRGLYTKTTNTDTDRFYEANSPVPRTVENSDLSELKYENGKYVPMEKPIRTKTIEYATYRGNGGMLAHVNGKPGLATKVIRKEQCGTNNQTKIVFDYVPKNVEEKVWSYHKDAGEKVIELSRDLKNGDVLELTTKCSNKTGKIALDKLALRSGKAIENLPEFFNMLLKELDPLAKNVLKAVMHL